MSKERLDVKPMLKPGRQKLDGKFSKDLFKATAAPDKKNQISKKPMRGGIRL